MFRLKEEQASNISTHSGRKGTDARLKLLYMVGQENADLAYDTNNFVKILF